MFCVNNSTCLVPTTGTASQAFAAALNYFAATQCFLKADNLPDVEVPNFKSFDFIIIGGGTSGSVVANRLSEIRKWNILLIEAGGDPPIESNIPGFDQDILDSKYNWKFMTSNNNGISQAIEDGSINLVNGKMLGGSSSLNNMFYMRGNDRDFLNWYDAGNRHWSVENVRRCFKKAESLQNQEMLCDPKISQYYGYNGPLVLNKFNSTLKTATDGVLKAWNEIRFKHVADLNAAGLFGSGVLPVTAADGHRQSSHKAYLVPVKQRPNLKILKNAFVKKILITEDTKVAFGVEVEKQGKMLTFYSVHEVILSAGAVNSPKILMLSGIGPEENLRSNNITCIVDSPMVGKNMQDHLSIPMPVFGNDKSYKNKKENEEEIDTINYFINRVGRLTHSSVMTDIAAFYSIQKNVTSPECLVLLSIKPKNSTNLKDFLKSTYRYKDQIVDSIVETNKDHVLYLFTFSLLHPYSRGNITLRSNNPRDPPLVFLNYFDDKRDLKTAIKGLQMASKVVDTKYFISNDAFLGRINWTDCDRYSLYSQGYWECISTNMVTSLNHLVGTCKMGQELKTSVVDSLLKVHGVSHLRVIDASVMPTITSGDIYAPSVMIGERGSELVKQQYDNNYSKLTNFMQSLSLLYKLYDTEHTYI